MRLRLPMRRAVLFGALLLIALLLTLPARIVLGALVTGLSAREVRGSVWSGRLVEARAGAAVLGSLAARLDPLALFVARARVGLARDGSDRFEAALSTGGATRVVEGLTGTVPIEGGVAGVPVGALTFESFQVRFRDGRCDSAEGLVRASIAAGEVAGVALPQGLSGAARCDKGALLVPLASAAGSERVTVTLSGDGRWSAAADLGGAALGPAVSGQVGSE